MKMPLWKITFQNQKFTKTRDKMKIETFIKVCTFKFVSLVITKKKENTPLRIYIKIS